MFENLNFKKSLFYILLGIIFSLFSVYFGEPSIYVSLFILKHMHLQLYTQVI